MAFRHTQTLSLSVGFPSACPARFGKKEGQLLCNKELHFFCIMMLPPTLLRCGHTTHSPNVVHRERTTSALSRRLSSQSSKNRCLLGPKGVHEQRGDPLPHAYYWPGLHRAHTFPAVQKTTRVFCLKLAYGIKYGNRLGGGRCFPRRTHSQLSLSLSLSSARARANKYCYHFYRSVSSAPPRHRTRSIC